MLRVRPALLVLTICLTARADERPLREVVDAEVQAAWQRQKIAAPVLAGDAVFLRRATLDLVGTIPTHDEVRTFLADTDPKKREKLIDRLLADPRFAVQQAQVWDLLLFGRNPPGGDATRIRDGFRKWLAGKFAANEPLDRLARALLLAEEEGSQLFYVQYRNQPEETATAVSRLFLGTQLQCARCHDHPYEKWTQRDFYGLAAFFARLVIVDAGAKDGQKRYLIGEKDTGDVLFTGPTVDQKPGKKGEPVGPKFLGGVALDEPPAPKGAKEPKPEPGKVPKPAFSRKEKLAAWVTAADNPYFARAAANRVWAQLMGRGLVHPVDDLSEKNAPSHPALLDEMARRFAPKFDLKELLRELTNSRAYQTTDAGPSTEALPPWFERARVRPLSAEELLASIRTATGHDAVAGAKVGGDTREYIVRYFGEPTNGRGDFQASLGEHLFLNNSGQLRQMIQARKGNLADRLLTSKAPWPERVDVLFVSVLSRPPRPAERDRFVKHFASGGKPEALVEEAVWALVNCSEFRFNR